MRFSFCTGVLSPRSISGKTFDLQAGPPVVVREIAREPPITHGDAIVTATSESFPHWVYVAADELKRANSTPLGDFFRAVTGPSDHGEHFARLVRLYALLSAPEGDSDKATRVIGAVAREFPTASDGMDLKIALFGSPSLRRPLLQIDEPVLLAKLATTQHYTCFDAAELTLRDRAMALWERNAKDARRLLIELFQASLNPLGEEILRGLIVAMQADHVIELAESESHLLAAALRIHPRLAALTGIWQCGETQQRRLFDAISSIGYDFPSELITDIVSALLNAQANVLAKPAYRVFGDAAIRTVLNWVNDREVPIPVSWRDSLARRQNIILEWLNTTIAVKPRTPILLSVVLDPHEDDVRKQGSGIWLSAIAEAGRPPQNDDELRFRMFVLALALQNTQPHAERLAAFAFPDVHAAVASSEVDRESWQMIERELPEISWSLWWDKCERLRRGLVHAFVRYEWPPLELPNCAPELTLFRAVKKSARKVSGGRTLVAQALSYGRKERETTLPQ